MTLVDGALGLAALITLVVIVLVGGAFAWDELRHWRGKRTRQAIHRQMRALIARRKALHGDALIDAIEQRWESDERHWPRIVRKVR